MTDGVSLNELKSRSPTKVTVTNFDHHVLTGRPIISSARAPTERISTFVDIQLKPMDHSLPSFVRGKKDFISGLQAMPPPDSKLGVKRI